MPNLKLKSEENLEAAEILIDGGIRSASIHCYYYSIFQLSMHILYTNHIIDLSEDKDAFDTHNHIINLLSEKIKKQSILKGVDYIKHMNELKKLRKMADYSDSLILDNDVEFAKDRYYKLNKILAEQYNIA